MQHANSFPVGLGENGIIVHVKCWTLQYAINSKHATIEMWQYYFGGIVLHTYTIEIDMPWRRPVPLQYNAYSWLLPYATVLDYLTWLLQGVTHIAKLPACCNCRTTIYVDVTSNSMAFNWAVSTDMNQHVLSFIIMWIL